MIAALRSPLIEQWRQEFGGTRQGDARPRPCAALGYMTGGPVVEGLIAVERLILTVLYDEPLPRGGVAVRLAGFTGRRIPWGVRWGGPGQCRFFKDLRLQPVPGGPGLRLDLAHERLLRLGLQLAHELDRRWRRPSPAIRNDVRLPCLWAGFPPEDAVGITGDGPELAEYAQRTRTSPERLLARICREHLGLILYPLPWVSHRWRQALSVFADLEHFPRQQVFRLQDLPGSLIGFQGAAAYDLFHGQVHPRTKAKAASPRQPILAAG